MLDTGGVTLMVKLKRRSLFERCVTVPVRVIVITICRHDKHYVRKVFRQCGDAVMRHGRLQSIDVVENDAEGVAQQAHLMMDAFSSLLAKEAKPNTEPAHARDDLIL